MTLLIESPWLGLLPAVLFLAAYRTSRKRLALVAGLGWLGYSVYEYGMSQRWLCSGECNIRIDLLLIYPVLVLASVMAALRWFGRWRGGGVRHEGRRPQPRCRLTARSQNASPTPM